MQPIECSDFDEYSDELPPRERTKLEHLAQAIIASQSSVHPISLVAITGHADQALRVAPGERQAFEMEVSVKRAMSASRTLKQILSQTDTGRSVLVRVAVTATGRGALHRIHDNPTDDAQRARNRRVVLNAYERDDVPIHPMPPMPRPTPSLDQTFRIKLMHGASLGQGLGGFGYTFVVWDTLNDQAAVYDYFGAAVMEGFASPLAGESDWGEFTIDRVTRVDLLGGVASHSLVTLLLSGMILDLPVATVHLLIGPAVLAATENGWGTFTYRAGSIKEFHGD